MKQQLTYQRDSTVRFRPSVDGQAVTVPSATVTIKRSDGLTDLPDSAVVDRPATVDADGLLSFALTDAQLAYLELNIVVEWVFTWNDVTYRQRDLADVVRSPIYPSANDDDLRRRMGKAIAGVMYQQPDRTYADELMTAWEELLLDLEKNGNRPSLIIEAAQLVEPHCALALANIYDGQSDGKDDKFAERSERQRQRYRELMSALPLRYDGNDSGSIQGGEGAWKPGKMIRY